MNPLPQAADGAAQVADPGKRVFRIGTLSYSVPALLWLMFWLLLGDFCFYLMEGVVPSVLPLLLNGLSAPGWLIALFLTTIPSLFNATVCPAVSYWSDRHRGPLGRRIPFILYTLPFLCFFLIMLGLAPSLGPWLAGHGWVKDARVASLALLGLFVIGFQFFNMFVASIFYYLFNDVVPHEFLGRFLAVFRFVGVAAGGFYYFFIFPKAETHFLPIFAGAALLYGVVFFLMCRNVKEGAYPPPPPLQGHGAALPAAVRTFFRESFSHRFYWFFYLFVAFWAVAVNAGIFQIFFAKSVGLSLEQIGQYAGTAAAVGAVLLLPCGILSDKYSPVRTLLVAATAQTLLSALPLVFLFFPIPPEKAFLTWCIVFGASIPVSALFTASELPTYMQLLPRERYGQFSASTALVRSAVVIVAGLACGFWIDFLKAGRPDPDTAYRFLPFWPLVFQTLASASLWMLYREWRKRGGEKSYTPPAVD